MNSIVLPLLPLVVLCIAESQTFADPDVNEAPSEILLTMPEPPTGYAVSKHPLMLNDKLLGFQVQAMKEGAVSKVVIKIDLTDRSARPARFAACKAYVNGMASGLKQAGFNIKSRKLPDIAKADFRAPVIANITYANEDGAEFRVRHHVFFSDKGYDVQVVATDDESFQLLWEWAKQIRAAATTKDAKR